MSAPIRILIAALGGEGGGVLASWIADAAIADGYVAQRTSVPGVAQRTGSTTYYLELVKTDGRRPVLALSPAPGLVDLFIASELLEATRQVQAGYVTPDRTFVIAPTHRVFTIHEKIAMGDGRADSGRMTDIIRRFARESSIADFGALAQKAGCQLNAVLLGLAARNLPISHDAFRNAIKADGRAVEANLRGFEAGVAYRAETAEEATKPSESREATAQSAIPSTFAQEVDRFPEEVRAIVREGIARLIDFQNERYAAVYIDRLNGFIIRSGASALILKELARHLAVRMTSEDVIRVAQLKLRSSRLERVRAEARAKSGDMIDIIEFLKPGPAEIFSIFPAGMARRALAFLERRGWSKASFPMKVRTTGLRGFLKLRLLSSLRCIRPFSLRAAEEKAWIEAWLALIERTHAVDPAAALELVQTASLVRGYGDTWERGHANWRLIVDDLVEPMLRLSPPPGHFSDALLQARLAASADPEGVRLRAVLQSVAAGMAKPAMIDQPA